MKKKKKIKGEFKTKNIFKNLKGQFTPGTKSVRYIWDVKRNYLLLLHFGQIHKLLRY